jgi:prepilin-type N-terminal cleavage/methylation domain-containing protein
MKANILRGQKGFSLLEIMIVTIIMAVMALAASKSIKTAMQNKRKIDARLKTETLVFDALRFMSTDVEKAFHYQYTTYEMERQAALAKEDRLRQNPQNNPNPQAPPAQPPIPPVRYTQFIGKENSMHFTSLNNQRTTANSQESDQVEVGYFLATCKSRLDAKKESSCLWRRSSLIIDNDVTRGGEATPLVENVTDFKLEYLSDDPQQKEWKKIWQTDTNGDAITQNMFPYLVRITLGIQDKTSKEIGKFKQTVVAAVRFTNNTDPAKRFAYQAPAANGGTNNAGTNTAGTNGGTTGGTNGSTTGGTSGGTTSGGGPPTGGGLNP